MNIDEKAVNTLRFLSADGVQKAKSGHPGLPMGTAAIAYVIWMKHLRFNPHNTDWWDRDRFVLSGGHGSMLLYSMLHLTGSGLTIEDLQQFRQWGSRTPGHPEFGLTPGVETTTGPLGQGFANGVGMAIAEEMLANRFNRPGFKLVDHYVYAIVTDGDLMEGVTAEAASLAGHLKLGKLIYFYDDNRITIDGSTDLSFTEDRAKRFEAYGWQVLHVADGNDLDSLDKAVIQAKRDQRPSLIVCRTHIGYGLPTRQDTAKAHGEPPGEEELAGAKEKLGWPVEPSFYVPQDVRDHFTDWGNKMQELESEWNKLSEDYSKAFPGDWEEFKRRMQSRLPDNWQDTMPEFTADLKGIATRVASGQVLNSLAAVLPELVGGSADLTPSNNTWIKESSAFQADHREGRYLHFGIREHAMGSIVNGMAYHKGFIPFGATFLVFTDYMRGALRLSALSHLPAIWVMTHDSIGLGEDGPTHQPVEHLVALRSIPNMTVIRPADANETREAWKAAIENKHGPTVLALTRQALPIVDRSVCGAAEGLHKGAYILAEFGSGGPDIILMASGSEVTLVFEAGKKLAEDGHRVRIVSFPSWELFKKSDPEYQEYVLPQKVKCRIAVELGVAQGWEKWVGSEGGIISIETFGGSAPYLTLFEKYGFTVGNVVRVAKEKLNKRG